MNVNYKFKHKLYKNKMNFFKKINGLVMFVSQFSLVVGYTQIIPEPHGPKKL